MSLEQHGGGEPVVSLRGVGAARAGRDLWSGVDLDVGPGRFVAVLGPNGVGKSTLLGMLLGELAPARGLIRVLGEEPGRRNAEVGYMPQRRSFDPGMQVRGRDVVGLGVDGARWGFPLPWAARFTARGRDRARRIDEVIDLVGASGYADRPVGRCSGGEQQRLLIAQALAARPRLLLLDEPLDSLDLPNQSGVAALIASIAADQGIAVVIVAHDVNPILSHLDTVVYLAPGACEVGPPQRVITSERLTRLFGTPIDVLTAGDGRTVVVGQPRPDHASPALAHAAASGAGQR